MHFLKRLRLSRYEYGMFACVAIAVLLRFILIYFNWPVTNSDEANMGLVALHVAYQGDHPVFFYGLPYMGPLEGYVAAALFHLFGPSLFTLRLALLVFIIGFLISMFYLVRLLYTEKFALATVALLSLGSPDVLFLQMRASGEYPEMLMFAPLICLLAAWLALNAHQYEEQRVKRIVVYGLLGLSIGLAAWVDFLILPFVAMAGLLLLFFCRGGRGKPSPLRMVAGGRGKPSPLRMKGGARDGELSQGETVDGRDGKLPQEKKFDRRDEQLPQGKAVDGDKASRWRIWAGHELLQWQGLSLLLGFIVGAAPLIYYNLTAPLSQNSLAVLLSIHHGGAEDMVTRHLTWLNQLTGTVLVALPWATGSNPRCPVNAIPPFGSPSGETLPCFVFQSGWGIGYLVLWCVAAAIALRVIWPYLRQIYTGFAPETTFEERRRVIRQCGRLALLLSVGLTLVLYAIAPSPAVSPDTSFRYLTCALLALPVLLWPFWSGLSRSQLFARQTAGEGNGSRATRADADPIERKEQPASRSFAGRVATFALQGALLLLVALTFVSGTVRTFADVPRINADYQHRLAVIHELEQLGATRVYSEYWTCNWLAFMSDEKIICSVLDAHLNPGFDRYSPYRAIVRAAPRQAYVFPIQPGLLDATTGRQQEAAFQQRLHSSGLHYTRSVFEGYAIYLPQ